MLSEIQNAFQRFPSLHRQAVMDLLAEEETKAILDNLGVTLEQGDEEDTDSEKDRRTVV